MRSKKSGCVSLPGLSAHFLPRSMQAPRKTTTLYSGSSTRTWPPRIRYSRVRPLPRAARRPRIRNSSSIAKAIYVRAGLVCQIRRPTAWRKRIARSSCSTENGHMHQCQRGMDIDGKALLADRLLVQSLMVARLTKRSRFQCIDNFLGRHYDGIDTLGHQFQCSVARSAALLRRRTVREVEANGDELVEQRVEASVHSRLPRVTVGKSTLKSARAAMCG